MKNINPLALFDKKITVPTSKSVATRALILASRISRPIWLKNLPDSTDVINLKNALELVGIEFKKKGNDICVLNSFPECEKSSPLTLDTGDGGTTNRFLLSLLSKGKRKYRVRMDKEMRQRPLEELISVLKNCGAHIFWKDDVLVLKGPVKELTDSIEVDCSRSSQFASSLALCFDQDFKLKNFNSSQSYFELTQSMKKDFFNFIEDYEIPTDMSSLSYPLALASVLGKVEITNFKYDSLQPDSIFINILKDIGVEVFLSENRLIVKKSTFNRPIDLDCSSFPDLVPTLCFLATKIKGINKLKGLNVLVHKESDRLRGCFNLLKKLGVDVELHGDELCINGNPDKKLKKFSFKAPRDHRMVMMAAMLMASNSGGSIDGFHHINKSYSSFADLIC